MGAQAGGVTATWRILAGDCRDTLATLEPGSAQTCVTSPPYFGLRDYGHDGQIGLELAPDEYVAALVGVFREVRRVLRDDGTVWLNLGDSYAGSWGNQGRKAERGTQRPVNGDMLTPVHDGRYPDAGSNTGAIPPGADYKSKDLFGIPWMVAFALRADGWYLRSDVIWSKPNPMPESVTDRPTKAHEYVFLLSKGPRYFYDADAVREAHESEGAFRARGSEPSQSRANLQQPQQAGVYHADGRNRRSVWTVATQPFPGAHFATFPPKLIEPCILAGSREGDTVLDPFAGSGTTGLVALRHGRSFIGCELSPAYAEMARERIIGDSPLLNTHAEAVVEGRAA